MKKILLLDSDYPSAENLYGNVFVHTRVKEYIKQAEIKVVSFFREMPDHQYEGIKVKHVSKTSEVLAEYFSYKPDAVFIHFYDRRLFPLLQEAKIPVIIWVHGYEALGWYRRLFNFTPYWLLRNVHRLAYDNMMQMIGFRRLISFANKSKNIRFVFVSNWMKKVSEQDSLASIKQYSIIPNPINCSLFAFNEKPVELRKKILLLRPFHSNKYANDIAIAAIIELSKRSFFDDLEFTICGQGKLFDTLTAQLAGFRNVYLQNSFIPNKEIPALHKEHGIFLCPTRQDAQGVSMCEAMSSGLVPVTSDNTAIPEFVKNKFSGILAKSARELADAIEFLYNNPSVFAELSRNAANSIRERCDINKVIQKELSLL